MEENMDKRTSGNDILREAIEDTEARAAAANKGGDTVIFSRNEVKKQTSSASQTATRANMDNTAEIKGGAVIRPLKQNQPPPRPAPQPNIAPARYEPKQNSADRTNVTRPQNGAVNRPQTPMARPAAPQQSAQTPMARPAATQQSAQTPMARPAAPQQSPQPSATRPTSPQTTQSYAAAQRRSAPVQSPNAQTPIRPAAPINTNAQKPSSINVPNTRPQAPNVKPAQPVNAVKEVDYEIDAATYSASPAKMQKAESSVADSVSSSVMSVVKAVVYIVAIIAVSIALAVVAINTANDIFKFVVDEKVVTVEIPEYASIDEVADALYDAGAIKYKWAFRLWSALKDSDAEFIEGTYEVSTTLNYDYLRAAFKKSTSREEVRITIPEGSTVDEIIDRFLENGIGTKQGFVNVINNYDFDYRFLEGVDMDDGRIYRLEGYLFPDTYNFYKDSSEVVVLTKLLDNFDKKFIAEYYTRCEELGLTVDEAIILASMVEKETRYADELGYVSSVFHNRLNSGGRYKLLQSDATAVYAIAHDRGERPDNVTGEHMQYDSPYNTYLHEGLPPSAIANPGLNAIKYALYPNDTDYYYFVADSSGRSLFARTEPEHTQNINTVRGNQ